MYAQDDLNRRLSDGERRSPVCASVGGGEAGASCLGEELGIHRAVLLCEGITQNLREARERGTLGGIDRQQLGELRDSLSKAAELLLSCCQIIDDELGDRDPGKQGE